MKNILFVLFFCVLAGCQLQAKVLGSTQERNLSGFSKIEVDGLVNVIVLKGDSPKAVVQAYGIDIDDVTTHVKDGTLIVSSKNSHRGESILVTVTYQQLLLVKTLGSSTIKSDGAIKSKNLEIMIGGSGDANLELDVGKLSVTMEGAGNLTLHGKAESQNIISKGSRGSLDNSDLII